MNKPQPDYETKVRTLNLENTGWDYMFDPGMIAGSTLYWTNADWIRLIGDHWFQKPVQSVIPD